MPISRSRFKGAIKDPKSFTLAEKDRASEFRTGLFAIERALGAPVEAIAKKYAVSKAEVENALTHGERMGFLDAYRDLLRDRLVPVALTVYEYHLKQGSLEAARDILNGLGILGKGQLQPGPGDEVQSLALWRLKKASQQAALPHAENDAQLQ